MGQWFKNPPANSRDMGSTWSRKKSHAQVPQWRKLTRSRVQGRNKSSHLRENPAHQHEEQPLLTAVRESSHTAPKIQLSQIINKQIKLEGGGGSEIAIKKFHKKKIKNPTDTSPKTIWVPNKRMKRCSTWLIIREWYLFTPIRKAISRRK